MKLIADIAEIVGLVLAFLDFTGLSHRLEVRLDAWRERSLAWVREWGLIIIVIAALLHIPLLALAWILDLEDTKFWITTYLIVFFLPELLFVTFLLLAFIVHAINKPKAGTVGTMGLLVAIIGFVLSHIE